MLIEDIIKKANQYMQQTSTSTNSVEDIERFAIYHVLRGGIHNFSYVVNEVTKCNITSKENQRISQWLASANSFSDLVSKLIILFDQYNIYFDRDKLENLFEENNFTEEEWYAASQAYEDFPYEDQGVEDEDESDDCCSPETDYHKPLVEYDLKTSNSAVIAAQMDVSVTELQAYRQNYNLSWRKADDVINIVNHFGGYVKFVNSPIEYASISYRDRTKYVLLSQIENLL